MSPTTTAGQTAEIIGSPHDSSAYNYGHVNIAYPGPGVALCEEIEGDGEHSAGEESVSEWLVHASIVEHLFGSDQFPYYRCAEKNLRAFV